MLSIAQLVIIVLSVTKIYSRSYPSSFSYTDSVPVALLAILPQLYTVSMLRSLNSRRELRLGAEAEARQHFNYEDDEKQSEDLFDVEIMVEGETKVGLR